MMKQKNKRKTKANQPTILTGEPPKHSNPDAEALLRDLYDRNRIQEAKTLEEFVSVIGDIEPYWTLREASGDKQAYCARFLLVSASDMANRLSEKADKDIPAFPTSWLGVRRWLTDVKKVIKRKQTAKSSKKAKRKSKAKTPQPEHSLPLPMTKWALIFGISANKLRELREQKKYHFRKLSERLWTLPKHELPAEYLEKYRQYTSQTQAKTQ